MEEALRRCQQVNEKGYKTWLAREPIDSEMAPPPGSLEIYMDVLWDSSDK